MLFVLLIFSTSLAVSRFLSPINLLDSRTQEPPKRDTKKKGEGEKKEKRKWNEQVFLTLLSGLSQKLYRILPYRNTYPHTYFYFIEIYVQNNFVDYHHKDLRFN